MRSLLPLLGALTVVFVSNEVAAQTPAAGQCTTAQNCPRPVEARLRLFCANISTRLEVENEDSPFFYRYEQTLWEMAGARPGMDTEETAYAKIRQMWALHREAFVCDDAGLRNGNALKYGVQNRFVQFIKDMVQEFGVDINFRDPQDGLTVLDYTRSEIVRLQRQRIDNAAMVAELQYIHDYLRQHGARYANELPAITR